MQEWLPEDHLAYFISAVDQLDLSKIADRYEQELAGRTALPSSPPYHPLMMVKVLLYGYCVGVSSSRRIAQRLHEDIAFRVLAANNTPDFRTISDFRKDNLEALSGLFLQVLALCQQAGLVKLGHVALDGTKVKANASKPMSYQRMQEKEAQLAAEVAELLRRAQAADEEEDRRYGKDKRGDELPEELAGSVGEDTGGHGGAGSRGAGGDGTGPRPKVVSIRGCPTTRPSATSPMPSSRIMPAAGGKDFLRRTTARRWWTALTR